VNRILSDFPFLKDDTASAIRGGRAAAEAALARINPADYALSRNFLDGAVTQLSPYLRHGVLTLVEVRDQALAIAATPEAAGKLINELAWRDYWQRLYAVLGNEVWNDREEYKTGFTADTYTKQLPSELSAGTTGLHCMDNFSRQLRETGYLHNHARMWMAAYIVHWLRIRWQAGAAWFLQHLLDGDPASNNLSWQWVASTFGSKPYFFNRENLERYTAGRYCKDCALRTSCPLEGTYEDLETVLFPHGIQTTGAPPFRIADEQKKPEAASTSLNRPLLWIHTDSLNPKAEILARYPQAKGCFVWDEAWLREEHVSSKRVVFLAECIAEMPSTVAQKKGNIADEVLRVASAEGADHIVVQRTPDPRLLAAAATIEKHLPIVWIDPPPFTDAQQHYDLRRFSRYWQTAKRSAMQPTPFATE
jgi:deoxyribodipyrimidine photo-lyase